LSAGDKADILKELAELTVDSGKSNEDLGLDAD
jgi:hypothetical protein